MSMSVESVFYEEARKRLAEMFSSDDQNGVSSPRQVSKSLGRILSLPGYNSSSPIFSPGRDEVDSPCLMRSSLLQKIIQSDSTSNFSPSHSIESSSYSDNNLDSGPHVINSSQSLIDHAALIPEIQQLSFEECGDSQLILTSTVLESNLRTYMEDLEAMLKYVRSVLESSGLVYNKLPERWQLSDQLLDPFVFDEVEILYGHLIDDSKLLFDCINEVLVEIRDKYLICTPWMSFITPNVRPTLTGESFVHKVCKGVDRHLQTVCPYTLDRVMRKDLEVGTWMNVRLETEGAVFEVEEVILDYIMEETILELWE